MEVWSAYYDDVDLPTHTIPLSYTLSLEYMLFLYILLQL